jgi:glycosyltransferase involved in cell wall biosynthesis
VDSLLATTDSNIRVVVLIPRDVENIPNYRHLAVRKVGVLTGHAWEQVELPFYSFRGVLFTPGGGAPLMHPKNIVTIHDAAVFAAPAGYSYLYRKWYAFIYRVLCRSAMHILTVSNFSKRELIQWCGAKPSKITVTYLGSEHAKAIPADNSILQRHNLRRYGYVLAVSSRNPNKNFSGLISALQYLATSEIEVAIAGKTLSRVFKQTSIESSVVKDLGYVTDQELRSLYENAGCFVFPSLYEGFGLPPLEALALGCPSVVGNVASMPEIFDGMALFCDPHDPRDIAEKIHKAIDLSDDCMSRAALSQSATRYTWNKCAQETWGILLAAARGEQDSLPSR